MAQIFRSLLVEKTILTQSCICLPPGGVRMKKTSSRTLRRAWPSSDLLERLLPPVASVEPHRSRRSRSEKDYRIHKHSKRSRYPPQYLCQSPPAYVHPGTVQPHRWMFIRCLGGLTLSIVFTSLRLIREVTIVTSLIKFLTLKLSV